MFFPLLEDNTNYIFLSLFYIVLVMEELSNQGNPGGASNGVCHSSEGHIIPHSKVVISSSSARNGSHWTCLPKPSYHNYVEYLSESSTYMPNTSTEYIMANNTYLPVGSNMIDGNEVSGLDRSFFYNDPGKACAFKPLGSSSHDLDIRKVMYII